MLVHQFFLVQALCIFVSHAYHTVTIEEGNLIGTSRRTRNGRNIRAFIGIPYAEPPIGDLRFRSPVPKRPWNGTLRADKDSSQCAQMSNSEVVGSEDCLFANVYVPERTPKQVAKQKLLPVMVYIHGGLFLMGNASSNYRGPELLLDRDIVFVTFNYRLGILGFFSTGDEASPGNYGLKDQRLMLKWINRNIIHFGGDPQHVTLFGESAGAACVHLHALTQKSKGFFHRYILQSGTALHPWAFEDKRSYKKYGQEVAFVNSCNNSNTTKTVACMRKKKLEDLFSTGSILNIFATLSQISWRPTTEPKHKDAFITETPDRLIWSNQTADYPFIIGSTKDEGLIFTSYLFNNTFTMLNGYELVSSNIPLIMMLGYFSGEISLTLASKIRNFYFDYSFNDTDSFLRNFTNFVTDAFFYYPQMVYLRHISKPLKSNVYMYSFDYRGSCSRSSLTLRNNNNVGVEHTDDLQYFFVQQRKHICMANVSWAETDYHMIDILLDLWTSFVTIGVPKLLENTKDPYIWQSYTKENNIYLQIGDNKEPTLHLQSSFYEKRMKFWFHAARLPLMGKS